MSDIASLTAATAIQSTYAHYIIFGCGAFSLLWGVLQIIEVSLIITFSVLTVFVFQINKIPLEAIAGIVNDDEKEKNDEELKFMPWTDAACLDLMLEVNQAIKDVSNHNSLPDLILLPLRFLVAFFGKPSVVSICSKY